MFGKVTAGECFVKTRSNRVRMGQVTVKDWGEILNSGRIRIQMASHLVDI